MKLAMLRTAQLIVAITLFASTASAAVNVEKVTWQGWSNCYRVTNGTVELIVTSDVGPRIMRYAFVGGQNLFKEFADQLGKSGEQKFQLRGGHRVWKAPEDPIATWAPDNVPVQVQITPQGLAAREPVEPLTGLQKEMEIALAPEGTDSGTLVKGLKSQFAAIVTDGQGEMKGQLFRIAHLGFFDYMDTIAIIGALEQVIAKTKLPLPNFEFGKGLIAAQKFFADHAK